MHSLRRPLTAKGGFSLVELTIVVVILGVLAMMGVPKYRAVVERAKAVEAFTYCAQIESAQERYRARKGKYAKRIRQLDVEIPTPEHFRVSRVASLDWETVWEIKLTRRGPSSGFGNYKVAWNHTGFSKTRSTIDEKILPAVQ